VLFSAQAFHVGKIYETGLRVGENSKSTFPRGVRQYPIAVSSISAKNTDVVPPILNPENLFDYI
jgi:hypothetical protein